MGSSRKKRRSRARQRVAGLSIKKRLEALENIASKPRNITETVIAGALSSIQFAMDLIQIWQGLGPEVQTTIKAALDNVLPRFARQIDGLAPDEQMIQAAELIKVLRTMEKVLHELDSPVFVNSLSSHIFREELEDAILDARAVSEDLRVEMFKALHEAWKIRWTMVPREGAEVQVRPMWL